MHVSRLLRDSLGRLGRELGPPGGVILRCKGDTAVVHSESERRQPSGRSSPEASRSEQSTPSGRLLLRMPRSLHGALTEAAEREGTSLNQFITGTLASAIGWSGERQGTTARRPVAPGSRPVADADRGPARRERRRGRARRARRGRDPACSPGSASASFGHSRLASGIGSPCGSWVGKPSALSIRASSSSERACSSRSASSWTSSIADPERLREIELEQPVVADHLEGHLLSGVRERDAAVRRVLREPERGELLHHRARGRVGDVLPPRERRRRHPLVLHARACRSPSGSPGSSRSTRHSPRSSLGRW